MPIPMSLEVDHPIDVRDPRRLAVTRARLGFQKSVEGATRTPVAGPSPDAPATRTRYRWFVEELTGGDSITKSVSEVRPT